MKLILNKRNALKAYTLKKTGTNEKRKIKNIK
jgi:hypothetical protein